MTSQEQQTTPRFSIFIPAWNDEAWLPGAIESVLAQTYPHWEVVVGDNASTEDMRRVADSFDDHRIRYHRFETHVPIDENFNRTMLLCRNEWVQLLCADDRLLPTCLERIAEAIQAQPPHPRIAMVVTACSRVYPDGRSADRVWYGSKPKLPVRAGKYDAAAWFDLLMQDGQPPWNVGSVAIARDVLSESGGFFRPEVGLSCDIELSLRAAAYGDVVYIDEPLLNFTVRPGADSQVRLVANRSSGARLTPLAAALWPALRVHEHRRRVTRSERATLSAAVARSYLQRAAQHRVFEGGAGRRGALADVLTAVRTSPSTVLRPRELGYAVGAILAPSRVLEAVRQRVTARHSD